MSGAGVIWKIVKTAATAIPWGRVVENAPAVVDLVGRAKDRLRASPAQGLEAQLRSLQEENLKLADTLLKTSDHLEELTKALEVVAARQKMLTTATFVSLLIGISSLALWIIR